MNKAPLGLFVILFGRLWENVRSRSIKAESFQRAKCSDPICLCQIDPAVLVDNHPVITPRVFRCNHSIKQIIEHMLRVPPGGPSYLGSQQSDIYLPAPFSPLQ